MILNDSARLYLYKDMEYIIYIIYIIYRKKWKNMKTTIQISDELRQKLKLLAVYKNTTYENLLDELTEKELCELKLDSIVKSNKILRKKKK
jgi:predicted DNA-binding protein